MTKTEILLTGRTGDRDQLFLLAAFHAASIREYLLLVQCTVVNDVFVHLNVRRDTPWCGHGLITERACGHLNILLVGVAAAMSLVSEMRYAEGS